MNAKLRSLFFGGAALLLAIASVSCGDNAPDLAAPPLHMPEIRPTFNNMEVLSTPDREVSLSTDELSFRGALNGRVIQKFYEGDFAELERLAGLYKDGMRTGAGIEKLGPFYWSFMDPMVVDGQGVDKRVPDLISAWADQYPQSPAPYIAMAFMIEEVARQSARNGATPAVAAFQKRCHDAAFDYLTQKWELTRNDPYAHGLKIRLIASGASAKETWQEAFDAAKREHPGRYQIYFDAVNSAPGADTSLIKTAAAAEQIARDLAATMGEDGDIGYARTWWSVSSRYYGKLLFERGMVDWPRIRNGFYKMIEDYPDPWNVNTFARFSCIVGDAETLRILKPAVQEYPIDHIWSHEDREYCLLFADAQSDFLPKDQYKQ